MRLDLSIELLQRKGFDLIDTICQFLRLLCVTTHRTKES
ncbi:hypothetical protein NIES2104_04370 [Leptolyngbya sp. NIES-2104]|nr:hypothetical protein NIES2104_04370 [Leptolyngbya sp. NIES-2104]